MSSVFNTTPDYRRILAVLRREVPDRIPVYEFFSDNEVQARALGSWIPPKGLPQGDDEFLNTHIRNQYGLGYDYLSPAVGFNFKQLAHAITTDSKGQDHYFLDESKPHITSRADFDEYPWPDEGPVNWEGLEYCARHLPEGMKLIINLGGGLLEWAMWMMGAEGFCLAIYDDPELVKDVVERVNRRQVYVAKEVASHPDVIACILGDDMGFKTQTFIPPALLQEYVFPGLKNIVDVVHEAGKPFILHSCGNLTEVMDSLIDDVGIDAKHSYEDVIMPVAEAKRRWGNRIALLGGVDMDMLCRAEETELRAYVCHLMEQCGVGGGFAVGSGNSIANYVPPQNLFIMLDESLRCQGIS